MRVLPDLNSRRRPDSDRPHVPYRLSLKVFDDGTGRMWKSSVKDIGGDVLCVSQFTLLANTTKGNKPDFHRAMVRSYSDSRLPRHPRILNLPLPAVD